jgi:hypothetical protein
MASLQKQHDREGLCPNLRKMVGTNKKASEDKCQKPGCQMFLVTTYQNGQIYQNDHKMYQNGHKMYPKATKYTKSCKIDHMATKYINFFHCKTLQNILKLGFLGLKICHLATLAKSRVYIRVVFYIHTNR